MLHFLLSLTISLVSNYLMRIPDWNIIHISTYTGSLIRESSTSKNVHVMGLLSTWFGTMLITANIILTAWTLSEEYNRKTRHLTKYIVYCLLSCASSVQVGVIIRWIVKKKIPAFNEEWVIYLRSLLLRGPESVDALAKSSLYPDEAVAPEDDKLDIWKHLYSSFPCLITCLKASNIVLLLHFVLVNYRVPDDEHNSDIVAPRNPEYSIDTSHDFNRVIYNWLVAALIFTMSFALFDIVITSYYRIKGNIHDIWDVYGGLMTGMLVGSLYTALIHRKIMKKRKW